MPLTAERLRTLVGHHFHNTGTPNAFAHQVIDRTMANGEIDSGEPALQP